MTITNILQELTQSAEFPLLTALLLGLLVALNPCQLAINISALTYIGKTTPDRKRIILKGIAYAVGRTLTYSVLGWILMFIVKKGADTYGLQEILSKGEAILPYALILIGAVFIYRSIHHHHHDGEKCHNSGQVIKRNGHFGSLVLGMVLAFVFCPESAILYFCMLIPLSVNTAGTGALLPPVFALAAALPVLFFTWAMAMAVGKMQRIELLFERFQQWVNSILGALFICAGILFLME